MRRELLAQASGRTIELGAGTGANLDLYPEAVTELVLAEPDPHMAQAASCQSWARRGPASKWSKRRPRTCRSRIRSFDTAVFTLVLCTVPDPDAALAEVGRVLRPGGKLLFVEHVRSEDAGLARWQDRLEKPWRFIGDGCHCNRDTLATIAASSFELREVERGRLPKAPPIVRPLVRGSAVLAT